MLPKQTFWAYPKRVVGLEGVSVAWDTLSKHVYLTCHSALVAAFAGHDNSTVFQYSSVITSAHKMVASEGIEPTYLLCKRSVLPLN
jgi:hypothetical protein